MTPPYHENGHPVSVVQSEVRRKPLAPGSIGDMAEMLRRVGYALEGPKKSLPVRVAAFLRAVGIDRSSLRQSATKLKIPKSTLARAVKGFSKKIRMGHF